MAERKTMSERPTPETDAQTYVPLFGESMVPSKLARRLERERDEAREAADKWRKLHDAKDELFKKGIAEVERERDEAREERDFFAEEIKRMQEHIWKLHLVISMQSKTLSKHGLEEYIL